MVRVAMSRAGGARVSANRTRTRRRLSTIYIDESGSRNSRGGFFVVGFVKARDSHQLARSIRHIRQKHHYHDEIKFSSIQNGSLLFYFDVVECLAAADVRVGGSVYDAAAGFEADLPTWEQQARMARRLVQGNTNKDENIIVFLDLVQTPQGETVSGRVKRQVNQRLKGNPIVEAYDVDSRAMDLVQLADLVAGSIRLGRAKDPAPEGKRDSAKMKVAMRFRRAFELDSFEDVKAGKVNILTMGDLVDAEPIPGLVDNL